MPYSIRNTYVHLLALLLVVVSVSLANHVHAHEEHEHDEHTELCVACHYLDIQDYPNESSPVASYAIKSQEAAVCFLSCSIEQTFLPPVRGPPA